MLTRALSPRGCAGRRVQELQRPGEEEYASKDGAVWLGAKFGRRGLAAGGKMPKWASGHQAGISSAAHPSASVTTRSSILLVTLSNLK
jgi:hypothetical protein